MERAEQRSDLRIHLRPRAAYVTRDYLPDASGQRSEIKTLLMDEQDWRFTLSA